jgi:hypothetical protein
LEFKNKIKTIFKIVDDDFTFYYYEGNDRWEVDEDESFGIYKEEVKKPKIVIKLPDDDFLNQSYFQKSDKSNNDSAILAKLIEEAPAA